MIGILCECHLSLILLLSYFEQRQAPNQLGNLGHGVESPLLSIIGVDSISKRYDKGKDNNICYHVGATILSVVIPDLVRI